jgi:hypothetical protein
MTVDDLDWLMEKQNHRCAICCNELRRPYIDHCHSTHVVRGLLCCRCNNWLAAIEHSDFSTRATAYLESHRHAPLERTFRVNQKHIENLKGHKLVVKQRRIA